MSPSSRGRDFTVDPPCVRSARRADLDALIRLENAAFEQDRLSRRSLLRLIGVSSALVLVAEYRTHVAGACVVLLRAYSSRARLYSLAVAPEARGRGVGSLLLDAALHAAAERGAAALTLEVRADNAAARALYERHGFTMTGRSPDYYSDNAAALHFRKALPSPVRHGAEAGRAA